MMKPSNSNRGKSAGSSRTKLYIGMCVGIVLLGAVILVAVLLLNRKESTPSTSSTPAKAATSTSSTPPVDPSKFKDPTSIDSADFALYKDYIEKLRKNESKGFKPEDYEDKMGPIITSIHGRFSHLSAVQFTQPHDQFDYLNNSVVDLINNNYSDGRYSSVFNTITHHKLPMEHIYGLITTNTKLIGTSGPASDTPITVTELALTEMHFSCSTTLVLNELLRNRFSDLENTVLFERILYLSGILWDRLAAFCKRTEMSQRRLKMLSDDSNFAEKYSFILAAHLHKMSDTMAAFMVYLVAEDNYKSFGNNDAQKLEELAEKVRKEKGKEKELNMLIGRIYQLFEIMREDTSGIDDAKIFKYFKDIADEMWSYVGFMNLKIK